MCRIVFLSLFVAMFGADVSAKTYSANQDSIGLSWQHNGDSVRFKFIGPVSDTVYLGMTAQPAGIGNYVLMLRKMDNCYVLDEFFASSPVMLHPLSSRGVDCSARLLSAQISTNTMTVEFVLPKRSPNRYRPNLEKGKVCYMEAWIGDSEFSSNLKQPEERLAFSITL